MSDMSERWRGIFESMLQSVSVIEVQSWVVSGDRVAAIMYVLHNFKPEEQQLPEAIRIVNEAGYAVVPREVSEKMLAAGIKAGIESDGFDVMKMTNLKASTDDEGISIRGFIYTGIDEYKAMLSCGEIKPEDVK